MHEISFSQVQRMLSPGPFALLTTIDGAGRTNVMAVSWWTFASNRPATVAVCLSKKGLSGELILSEGSFGLCLVDEKLKEVAFRCGTVSGRTQDKAEAFGIELVPSLRIAPMLVRESCAALECRMIEHLTVQDHELFVAEVLVCRGMEGGRPLFAMDGYRYLDTIEGSPGKIDRP